MRIGRLKITHSGYPPYVPNWGIKSYGIGIFGWWFIMLPKEIINEIKAIEKLWR